MPKTIKALILAILLAADMRVMAQTTSGGVTVNPNALDQLSGTPPTPPPPHPAPPHEPPSRTSRTPAHPSPPEHATAAPPARPAPPTVPAGPPPPVALAPLSPPPPAHPTTPPPPAPVLADAPGVVSQIPDGTRITFGPLRADLNPQTDEALRSLARKSPDAIFNVMAFAAGNNDDPSTPRRLSLSRALNARSVLIAEGIPSTRIYVRALGPNSAEGPPDRVDITVTAPQSSVKTSSEDAPVKATP